MEQRSVEMQNSTDIFHVVLIMRIQRSGPLIVEGTTRRGTDTPVHRPEKTAGVFQSGAAQMVPAPPAAEGIGTGPVRPGDGKLAGG